MFIKTVSTTSGINPIKFDETGGVFYWILNTGLSTIYASTKSAFTAGDDGVVSLGPKESRRLETNNDTIYILGAGQVEIHNQRDGICSFKQAPTSSGSGGGGIIDAYSKTESDAKYAQKTDIPTSLPANGGNADTVDGYHVDNLIHESESKPPEYITEFLRINDDTKSIERWSTSNLRVEFANNAAKAKNADTLNGMSAETIRSMSKNVDSGTSASSLLADGTYCGVWSDAPSVLSDTQGILIVSNYNTNGAPSPWSHRTFYSPSYNNIWHGYTANYNWYGWKEISTTPIKSTTVSGTTDANGNLMLWAASENKIPICAILTGYCSSIFHYAPDEKYYSGVSNIITRASSPNVSISGTVYYI